jgi:hypothetical protein
MNKIILTDVDGVLLDWGSMFYRWMAEARKDLTYNPESRTYSLAAKYSIPEAEMHALVLRFNSSAAVGFCPAYKNSIHYVRRLHENGFKFVAVTAMGADRYGQQLRIQNLERCFGHVFINHHFTDLNVPKDDVLSLFSGTGYWWIEDKVQNAVAGLAHGLRPILMTHEHNEDFEHDDVVTATCWKDVYQIITTDDMIQKNFPEKVEVS